MSAKAFMSQPEADQSFGLLKDIVEIVKNPKAIDEAYERRRKAAELSDDEVKKSEEARALIARASSIEAGLKQRESVLLSSKKEHENKVEEHKQHAVFDDARLTEWERRLNDTSTKHREVEKLHAKISGDLDARAVEIESKHAAWEVEYNKRVADIANTEAAQKAENERLAEWTNKLKAKAARLAAEAQSDG